MARPVCIQLKKNSHLTIVVKAIDEVKGGERQERAYCAFKRGRGRGKKKCSTRSGPVLQRTNGKLIWAGRVLTYIREGPRCSRSWELSWEAECRHAGVSKRVRVVTRQGASPTQRSAVSNGTKPKGIYLSPKRGKIAVCQLCLKHTPSAWGFLRGMPPKAGVHFGYLKKGRSLCTSLSIFEMRLAFPLSSPMAGEKSQPGAAQGANISRDGEGRPRIGD